MTLYPQIDGVPLQSIDGLYFGPITRSYGEGGCLQASFSYYLPPGVRHSALRPGNMLEGIASGGVEWAGCVTEVDPVEGVIHARGYSAEAGSYLALDGSGNSTSNPRTAGNTAVGEGYPVTIDSSIPNANYTDVADGANTLAALWAGQASELGQYLTVFEDRVARMVAPPTTPVWQIPPGAVDLGSVSDDFTSVLKIVYRSGTSTYSKITVPDPVAVTLFGYRAEAVDVTSLGVITSTRATQVGNGLLAKYRSRMGWTQGFTVSKYDLKNMGMEDADLSLVRSLQMVRVNGVDDERQALFGLPYMDITIGEAGLTSGDEVIDLSPVGAVAETFDEIVADLAKKRVA